MSDFDSRREDGATKLRCIKPGVLVNENSLKVKTNRGKIEWDLEPGSIIVHKTYGDIRCKQLVSVFEHTCLYITKRQDAGRTGLD